jgi:hypothetical protein
VPPSSSSSSRRLRFQQLLQQFSTPSDDESRFPLWGLGARNARPAFSQRKEKRKKTKKQIHQSSAGMEKEEWRDEFCGRPNLFLLPSFALLLFVSLKERLEEGKRERDSFEIIGLLLMLGRCCMDGRMSARGRRGG